METYQFGEAGRQIYEFFWSEYCDWYLEISKIAIYRGDATARARSQATLVKVLDESLRLLHPFIPFVTEETWGYLKEAAEEARWPEALIVASWPESGPRDLAAEADMALIMEMVRAIRNVRAEYNVKPGHAIAAVIAAGGREALVRAEAETLCTLARLDPAHLTIAASQDAPPQSLTLVTGDVTTYLPLSELVDLDAERERLRKELAETEAQIARSEGLLGGPFAQRAPADVVAREQEKLAQFQARRARLRARLTEL
jgi:valyl-tRNA synthetase